MTGKLRRRLLRYLERAFVLALLCLGVHARAENPARKHADELARYDASVKPADRQHWAFLPVGRPGIPRVRAREWVGNPIDAFVLSRLEARGWQPAPPAEPRAFLRRLHLDLVGLPPTPAEQEAFVNDPSPAALEKVVSDLLARPGYGERWARHWLDLVRYAETNGYERDAAKPHVWRYRDYVIRAFNEDKPFDRFALEQLAGDELADVAGDTLIATGYNRLGPWDDEPADPDQDRFDQLDDMIGTTSQVFLGLTLGCARCHNHKFDPLTMHDYYRMAAVFSPLQRPRNGRTELDVPAVSPAQLAAAAERDRRIAALEQAASACRLAALRRGVAAMSLVGSAGLAPSTLLLAAESAADVPVDSRLSAIDEQVFKLRKTRPELPRGYFLTEPSPTPPATHLLIRGKASRPGPRVAPGVPAVLVSSQPAFPPSGKQTSLRRVTLARWIASPENPLTARVIVNRVWQFHFGEGLVRTPSDFGKQGEPPTHPELLDWLAVRFVKDGWSLKKLHRLILTSNTYRMSKRWHLAYGAEDPEDRLLWRVPYRRLEVEAIRDSMLAVSGRLNARMYGPAMYPFVPREALAGHSDPDKIWQPFDEKEASRRTVYAFIKRSMVVPMLEVLDLCDTARSSAKRSVTTVAPQALSLFNGDFVNCEAKHLAERLAREAGDNPDTQVERAYLLALCRPPTASERADLVRFLANETKLFASEGAEQGRGMSLGEARRRALEQMCRVIFNLNEFVYAD